MLRLPDVTLVAVSTVLHGLTRLAIEHCAARAEFGQVLVVTDKDDARPSIPHQIWAHPPFAGIPAVQKFLWHELPSLIHTSHFLWIHWDSWITCPSRWQSCFLDYDYIGAPWWYDDGWNVGNGGFSLRSTRLARYVQERPDIFALGERPEDDLLCRLYRGVLQSEGFRWPDDATASEFAFECVPPRRMTFGFHCLRNWPLVLPLEACEERIAMLPEDLGGTGNRDRDFALQMMKKFGKRCGKFAE